MTAYFDFTLAFREQADEVSGVFEINDGNGQVTQSCDVSADLARSASRTHVRPLATRAAAAIILVSLASVTGCAAGELSDVQVSAADLTNIELSSAAVLFGGTWGDGDLVVVDGVGDEQTFPVTLSGPSLGMMIDFSVDGEGALEEGEASFDLSAMELPTANDLLGLYTGPKFSGHLILGGASYELAGDNGAKLSIGLWGSGVSMYGGVEWLTLAAK